LIRLAGVRNFRSIPVPLAVLRLIAMFGGIILDPIATIVHLSGLICLQDKLQGLADHADLLESLPPNVRTRVEFLRGIQVE
jgi:hypothetical protein